MPSKTAMAGLVTACASIISLVLYRRAGGRRSQDVASRPPTTPTPEELAAKDAQIALGDDPFTDDAAYDDPLSEPDGPTRETPMGLDPTTMDLDGEREHYDAISVDELGPEWLRRAVQSDMPGKP